MSCIATKYILCVIHSSNLFHIDNSKHNIFLFQVQPIPELCELIRRSGSDGQEIVLDDSNIRAGTLRRSGSRRFKKNTVSLFFYIYIIMYRIFCNIQSQIFVHSFQNTVSQFRYSAVFPYFGICVIWRQKFILPVFTTYRYTKD